MTTLGAEIDLLAGFAFKSKAYTDKPTDIRLLRGDNIVQGCLRWDDVKRWPATDIESYDRYQLHEGDVVLAMDRPWVKAGLKHATMTADDLPCLLVQRTARLRAGANLTSRYLMYLLGSNAFTDHILGVQTGIGVPHISGQQIKDFEFARPPLAEQQRIVGILDEAFESIGTAKANTEKNLQNARALFESHLQSVFTQSGQDWKMEKLDTLTELARGHNPPKSTFSYKPKPGYVRFYQIRDGGTDDYAVYVPDSPQLHKMAKSDIMMVAYRHVGRAFRGVEGAFNVALCKISNARRDVLEDDYLFHVIPSPFVKGELLKRSERSLIPSMSIDHLRELVIPVPPLNEQKNIVKLINLISTQTERLTSVYERKLAALDELKKSLLHQAFSGQL